MSRVANYQWARKWVNFCPLPRRCQMQSTNGGNRPASSAKVPARTP